MLLDAKGEPVGRADAGGERRVIELRRSCGIDVSLVDVMIAVHQRQMERMAEGLRLLEESNVSLFAPSSTSGAPTSRTVR